MSNVTAVSKPLSDFPALVSDRARTLFIGASRTLVAICALHLAFWAVATWSNWDHWATGGLWGAEEAGDIESAADFWALPGSFMLPLALLALLIERLARSGRAAPAYVGWALTGWVVLCAAILMPSGFILGIIPGIMLIAASRLNSRAAQQKELQDRAFA